MSESATLEFKETISKSFLKTVSAFANYSGGTIVFGVDDKGNTVGIENVNQTRLDIENRINDNIKPQPNYQIQVNQADNTISLIVFEGSNKPYLYNSKAYKRNDTSTIEADTTEFKRLVLEGMNQTYDQLPSSDQNLAFSYLKQQFESIINISSFNLDTLKTLNLYNTKQGYNNAACLLSDNNHFPGIDIAVFGDNLNTIKRRITLQNQSILKSYYDAIDAYRYEYQYEIIEGSTRKRIQRIPEEAFREALANAIIHRCWDINPNIRLMFYADHISLTSPGALPKGISPDEYINGRISNLRNPILANIFYRLGIVEIFGTGIRRIKECYFNNLEKPQFNISDNLIEVILPLTTTQASLSQEQRIIYDLLTKYGALSIGEMLKQCPLKRTKVKEILQELMDANIIERIGAARSTRYKLQ